MFSQNRKEKGRSDGTGEKDGDTTDVIIPLENM